MEGDRQDDLVHHGGPDRALSLWSLELIEALAAEGHPIGPGAAGENVTLAGLDWMLVRPGARLSLGTVTVEVTGFAHPCRTIMSCFADRRFSRISEKSHPGWSRVYARVLEPGELRVGEEVRLSPLLAV
jgi:MOSC domain-containing protein YiiM